MRNFIRRASWLITTGNGRALFALGLTLVAVLAGGADNGSGP